jgi:hypothetical protein
MSFVLQFAKTRKSSGKLIAECGRLTVRGFQESRLFSRGFGCARNQAILVLT